MTYKYYIFRHRLKDSVASYERFNSIYNIMWGYMNQAMRRQYLEINYKYRFTEGAY